MRTVFALLALFAALAFAAPVSADCRGRSGGGCQGQQASAGCQGYQASCNGGFGSGRVFNGRFFPRLHDRRHSTYSYVAPSAPAVKPEAQPMPKKSAAAMPTEADIAIAKAWLTEEFGKQEADEIIEFVIERMRHPQGVYNGQYQAAMSGMNE